MKKVKAAGLLIALALVVLTVVVQPVSANPTTRQQSLKMYIDSKHDTVEGGYVLVDGQALRVEATSAALYILEELTYLDARPPIINLTKSMDFTWKLVWKSEGTTPPRFGGFGRIIGALVDIEATYFGVRQLEVLLENDDVTNFAAALENYERDWTYKYINETQTESGGFGFEVDASPDMISTFYAIYSLYALEAFASEVAEDWFTDIEATVDWILSCQEGNAFKLTPESERSGVTPTAAALMSLAMMERLNDIDDLSAVRSWILDRQVLDSETGGFIGGFEEAISTNDTNIVSTYYALKALEATGGISGVNDTVEDFIVDCQAVEGSWGFVPGLEKGTMVYASMAVESLAMLDAKTILNQEDPNNPVPPLVDWRYLLIVGIIFVAVIFGLIALRRD
ncbi:MAG: prenyltransferase/squalene oxidase repeat-containing protein [Candidatus Thorarchaeota archaeon]